MYALEHTTLLVIIIVTFACVHEKGIFIAIIYFNIILYSTFFRPVTKTSIQVIIIIIIIIIMCSHNN